METEMIKLWQDNNVEKCVMNFSCGGDSMNDTEFNLYDKNDEVVNCEELKNFFEEEVYSEVDFYEASDGHYQGEYGTVTITLEDDGDGELYFSYNKEAMSEWSEQFTQYTDVVLSDVEAEFVRTKVLSILGGDGETPIVNYKEDCILTDEEENIGERLGELFDTTAQEYEFVDIDVDGSEYNWYSFTTSDENNNDEITMIGNTLKLSVNKTFTVFKPVED